MNETTYYDCVAEINGRNIAASQYSHQLICDMNHRLQMGNINHGSPRPVAPMVKDGKGKMVVGGEGGATIDMKKRSRQKFKRDDDDVSEESEASGSEGGGDRDVHENEEEEEQDEDRGRPSAKRLRDDRAFEPIDIHGDDGDAGKQDIDQELFEGFYAEQNER